MINHGITTSLEAILKRVVESSIDEIAKEGISILKSIVDSSGFADSEYLKDYEIYSHVSGQTITFEITISFESLDEDSKIKLKESAESANAELETESTRTYGITPKGVIGRIHSLKDSIHDARRPTRDARRPALDLRKSVRNAARSSLDSRKTSTGRAVEHMVNSTSPRSMKVNRSGKLSILLKNQVKANKTNPGITLPNKNYSGIVGDFINKLKIAISEKFSPAIEDLLRDRLET